MERAAISRRQPPGARDRDESPFVTLPASAEDLLAGLSARFRANVRKSLRSLATLGEVSFNDVAGDTPQMADAYATLRRVEASSWKGREGGSVDADTANTRFYRALAVDGPASR